MSLAPLLLVLLADPVPVAGRPADFSGAVGGPFVVLMAVDRTEAKVGNRIRLTVIVAGPGDLSALRRPNLKADPEFTRRFEVEDGPTRDRVDPPGREFDYALRPRDAAADQVPRVKLVYFNPALHKFQTTYAEPIPLRVTLLESPPPEVPREVQYWARSVSTVTVTPAARCFPWPGAVAWVIPPTACLAWYLLWRRRRTTLSAAAQKALGRLSAAEDDAARQVADATCEFLREVSGLPAGAATPAEVSAFLYENGTPLSVIDRVRSLLARCDEDRFSRRTGNGEQLLADARALVRNWGARR